MPQRPDELNSVCRLMAKVSLRSYRQDEVAGFLKTRERFGGLSNMAAGYLIKVNDLQFDSSEALYQACRFPDDPDLQAALAGLTSPLEAKRIAHRNLDRSRGDWKLVNIELMRWTLRLKRCQNAERIDALLAQTGEMPIVEISFKDAFWGARPKSDGTVEGCNVLGRLWMELRQGWLVQDPRIVGSIEPAAIPNFMIAGAAVPVISAVGRQEPRQTSLFDLSEPS